MRAASTCTWCKLIIYPVESGKGVYGAVVPHPAIIIHQPLTFNSYNPASIHHLHILVTRMYTRMVQLVFLQVQTFSCHVLKTPTLAWEVADICFRSQIPAFQFFSWKALFLKNLEQHFPNWTVVKPALNPTSPFLKEPIVFSHLNSKLPLFCFGGTCKSTVNLFFFVFLRNPHLPACHHPGYTQWQFVWRVNHHPEPRYFGQDECITMCPLTSLKKRNRRCVLFKLGVCSTRLRLLFVCF